MSEYLISFEDGSEAVLSHHGVKGMKWGKWNEETKARYLSKGMKVHLAPGQAEARDLLSGGGGGYIDDDEKTAKEKEEEARKIEEERKAQTSQRYQNYSDEVDRLVREGDYAEAARVAANGSAANSEGASGFIGSLATSAANAAANSEAANKVKEEAEKAKSSYDKANELMEKGDKLSDSERAELRQKAKEEKSEAKRKKREEAKANGDPLWFLI